MRYKTLHAWLVTLLLISFAEAGVAQMSMQNTPGSSSGGYNFSTTSQTRFDTAGATRSSGLKVVPKDFAKLRLAPGFLVSLTVLDDPDLVGDFRIDQYGDIALPFLGVMHVAGETSSEARITIQTKLLEEQILKNPQVNLTVLEYTFPEVTIMGEVANPGKYPMLAPQTLVDVLALAGGTTLTAGNIVQIMRGNSKAEPIAKSILVHYSRDSDLDAVKHIIVNPGDTVLVKRAGIVYVLGAVTRPGGYVMQEEGTLNVLQALALANGTALAAKTGEIHILRRDDHGEVLDIRLSYKKLTHGKSTDVQLHPEDVIYVPMNKFKAALTNGSSILAGAASASIYAYGVH